MPPMTVVTSNTSSGIAAAIVVCINWQLALLATKYVMPQEVSAAVQFLLTYAIGEWVVASKNKAMAKQAATVQAVLTAPDPRDPPAPPAAEAPPVIPAAAT